MIVTDIAATRAAVAQAKARGLKIGLVPTMGALHAGHASLIEAARRETGFVVVSIFVNPTQFGPREDLARYPRPFERDAALCHMLGVDVILHPEPQTVYPPGFCAWVEVHGLQDVWEGASRPGHFRGVATVVLKLLNIVTPDTAYFGQKDAQQACIVRRMVADLDLPVELRICPTVREPDGLALSSRNQYLTAVQRRSATILIRSLEAVTQRIAAGERKSAALSRVVADLVAQTPEARLDYVALVDPATLQPLDEVHGPVLVLLAVFVGTTRLIDNVLLEM